MSSVEKDFENRPEYKLVTSFSEDVKGLENDKEIIQSIHKLWDSIIVLLSNHSSDPIVLDLVCKSFNSSSVYSVLPNLHEYPNHQSLLDLFLSSFLSFDWSSTSSPSLSSLVATVLSTIGCLVELFDDSMATSHSYSVRDFITFSLLPSSYSPGISTDCVLSAGGSFPQSLPRRFLELLLDKQVHFKLLDLVSNYMLMSEETLYEILRSIILFFELNPQTVMSGYKEAGSDNDSHLMLLFAASHFAASTRIQSQLWLLLNHILTKTVSDSQEAMILRDLNIQTILPTLATVAKEMCQSPNSMLSLCIFIRSYMSKCPMSFIQGVCFSDDQELLRYLMKGLSKEVESTCDSPTHRDIKCLCSTLHLFHSLCAKDTYCARIIQSYNFINEMAKAVQSCPLCCGHTYCMIIGSVALQNSIQPEDLQWSQSLEPLKAILTSPLPLDERADVYNSLHVVLKSSNLSSFIDRDFIDGFFTAFSRDIKELPHDEIRYLIYVTRLVIEPVKSKDFLQSLCDSNVHEAAIEGCLNRDIKRSTHEALLISMQFINYLMRLYQEYLGNIDSFVNCNVLKHVIDVILMREGAKHLRNYSDQYGSIVLSLTSTKRSSAIIYDQGSLELLYPLVSDDFESGIVRNTIHAVGNIALAGHHVKQDILSISFHSKLIQLLEKRMGTGDAYLLSACCRVLHILCSGDWAKRQYALQGLVTTLVSLCKTRNDSPEIVWRPLGLLSSISFMSLCNRQYLVSDGVMNDIIDLFKRAVDSKVISYFTLIVLAFSDLDRQFTYLSSRGVVRMIQTHMNNEAGNVDFKRWGAAVLERGYLFTVTERRRGEEEEELISLLQSSITWPPPYSKLICCHDDVSILLDDDSQLTPFFPEGSQTVNKGDVASLGIQDPVFRVSRYYGSTHGLCSNCDKEGPSAELVFRPHNLTPTQYQSLVSRGWYRRGGVKMFRYRYNHNIDCSDWETRVLLVDFNSRQRKSYRKVLKRMPEERLTIETVPTQFIQEAYELYNSYHIVKHDKPKKSRYSYCEHVVNSPMRNQYSEGGGTIEYGTYHQLYRLDGKLVAVGVIDVIPNGVVSIYMWYEMSKEISKYSFGVYSALKEIEYAQKLRERDPNIRYYYMQGWNGNNHKLAYKSNYEPEEFYSPCTVSDWVSGLDGVSECQKSFKEEKRREGDKDGGSNSNDVVAGTALPLDRVWYKRVNNGNGPLVDELLLCINDSACIKLKDLLVRYHPCKEQVETMRSKFEELMLALGPELCSNLIIDIKLCPPPSPPLSAPIQATD